MVKRRCSPILDKLVQVCTAGLIESGQRLSSATNASITLSRSMAGSLSRACEIGTAVENHNVMEITLPHPRRRDSCANFTEPVGILFSEYYFYLAAFIEGIDKDKHFRNPQDNSPTIYRIDRIQNYKTLDRHFAQRYTDRFQEGEMRKRIQFMYGGELQTIRFEYTGPSLESVLDRLPTAKVLQVTEKGWIIEAEVFGTGIQMWVRSQGDYVRVLAEQ